MELVISHAIVIPESELRLTAVRSGGPGGQNVNKLSTCMILEFDLRGTSYLNEKQKNRVAACLGHRVNRQGILRVRAQTYRTQAANRQAVIDKFVNLLRQALQPKRARLPTKVPNSIREERITQKKQRGEVKQARKKIKHGEE